MPKPLRYALRVLLIFAVAGSISFMSGPASTSRSPYLSALSDLSVGWTAKAQPACEFKRCGHPGQGNNCVDSTFATNCSKVPGSGGGCTTTDC